MHGSISAWCDGLNVLPPLLLDVLTFSGETDLPETFRDSNIDLIICINMIHISPWECTEALFRIAKTNLRVGGRICTYGPYKVDGTMVESNIKFDDSLRERCAQWGIRDVEAVQQVAEASGFTLKSTHEMPANNMCLFFEKR